MERIRRRKLCRDLKHVKRLFIYRRTKVSGYDVIDEVDSRICCSKYIFLHHPYDDDIHWVHALSDLLTSFQGWMWNLYMTLEPNLNTDLYRHMLKKSYLGVGYFYKITEEVYNADNRKEICHKECNYPTPIAKLENYRDTQVLLYGNYVPFADDLVEKAKQMVSSSKNKHERRRNMNKLVFFTAMSRMKSIYLECVYSRYNIDGCNVDD